MLSMGAYMNMRRKQVEHVGGINFHDYFKSTQQARRNQQLKNKKK